MGWIIKTQLGLTSKSTNLEGASRTFVLNALHPIASTSAALTPYAGNRSGLAWNRKQHLAARISVVTRAVSTFQGFTILKLQTSKHYLA